MKKLTVAVSAGYQDALNSVRQIVPVDKADWMGVSAAVLSASDIAAGKLEEIEANHLGLPVFAVVDQEQELPRSRLQGVLNTSETDKTALGQMVDAAAQKYEDHLLPPFFDCLERYVGQGNLQFDCPGHQGGAFFKRHPAGREFYNFFGESIFRADLCNADVSLGDLLIHEGAPHAAQEAAAKIYNADKTYFVLIGTSASNKVVLNAVLAPGDLVLFDRNNH